MLRLSAPFWKPPSIFGNGLGAPRPGLRIGFPLVLPPGGA